MTTRPPSATATPMRVTVPCEVVARSSTMEWAAASAAAGTAFCGPASVERGVLAAVSLLAVVSGCCDAGDSKTTTQATTATTAAAPMRTMMALRYWRRGGGGTRTGTSPVGGATSLGCRQMRSSGSIHPRSGASASSPPVPPSSGPG